MSEPAPAIHVSEDVVVHLLVCAHCRTLAGLPEHALAELVGPAEAPPPEVWDRIRAELRARGAQGAP